MDPNVDKVLPVDVDISTEVTTEDADVAEAAVVTTVNSDIDEVAEVAAPDPEVVEVNSDYEFQNSGKKKKFDAVKEKNTQINNKKENQLTCKTCNKVSKTKWHLQRHILTNHTKEEDMPFHCSVCKKGLATKDRMDNHMEQVHQKTSNYQCKNCIKYFSSKKRLGKHVIVCKKIAD